MRDIHTWLFLFSRKSFLRVILIFLCVIIPLAGAQVITEVNTDEIIKDAEKIYEEGKWEEAYAKIEPILPLIQNQISQYPALLQIQANLIAYGNKLLQTFDYMKSLAYYDKALTINPGKEILAQKEAIVAEYNSPKVLIEGKLINISANIAEKQTDMKISYLTNRTLKDMITFEQGDPLRIKFLWSEELQSLKFKLLNKNQKTISQATAFKLNTGLHAEQTKNTSWYAFLTTYVDQKPEIFNLIIDGTTQKAEHFTWRGTVELITKSFPECTINLNEKLTSLRTKPDPKKEEEAKYLQNVMKAFDVDAQYHTENFILPVEDAKITTQFGEKTIFAYNTGKKSTSTHIGIDYAKPTGTPIKAMGNGKVVLARDRIISGISVVIEHMPGIFTTYFHLSKLAVKEGDVVTSSQIIGEVGNTGLSTGAHLHLAMEICGVPVNPDFFIKNKLIFD